MAKGWCHSSWLSCIVADIDRWLSKYGLPLLESGNFLAQHLLPNATFQFQSLRLLLQSSQSFRVSTGFDWLKFILAFRLISTHFDSFQSKVFQNDQISVNWTKSSINLMEFRLISTDLNQRFYENDQISVNLTKFPTNLMEFLRDSFNILWDFFKDFFQGLEFITSLGLFDIFSLKFWFLLLLKDKLICIQLFWQFEWLSDVSNSLIDTISMTMTASSWLRNWGSLLILWQETLVIVCNGKTLHWSFFGGTNTSEFSQVSWPLEF